jgi:hypothetical protein
MSAVRAGESVVTERRRHKLFVGGLLTSCFAFAQTSVVGVCTVLVGEAEQVTSVVRIGESHGIASGRIDRSPARSGQDVRCDRARWLRVE